MESNADRMLDEAQARYRRERSQRIREEIDNNRRVRGLAPLAWEKGLSTWGVGLGGIFLGLAFCCFSLRLFFDKGESNLVYFVTTPYTFALLGVICVSVGVRRIWKAFSQRL